MQFNTQFDEAFDDDFSDGGDDKDMDSPEESGDFDADKLLNLNDYQKKRPGLGIGLGQAKAPPVNAKNILADRMKNIPTDDKKPPQLFGKKASEDEEMKNFDYKNTDLNKCTDEELAAHKAAMDKKFAANQLKPGDPGFKYDVRVKYDYNADEALDNSWDEDDEEVPDVKKATNDIYDEDFADIGGDDDDYFDDDFA